MPWLVDIKWERFAVKWLNLWKGILFDLISLAYTFLRWTELSILTTEGVWYSYRWEVAGDLDWDLERDYA